ncbi:hypothetical protein B0H17DRAFT_1046456 [Mycena rosella]|uniref:Uncharacterized protein n=1 Tax=Mycena rosella TaxID=1033263 RepID=A0AAD7DVH6_MYCRO|nr:hypothetical protein B0H17DRAFT_1046456 [Mycena rosella]
MTRVRRRVEYAYGHVCLCRRQPARHRCCARSSGATTLPCACAGTVLCAPSDSVNTRPGQKT